jgi:hypothetical protein
MCFSYMCRVCAVFLYISSVLDGYLLSAMLVSSDFTFVGFYILLFPGYYYVVLFLTLRRVLLF